MEDFAVIYGEAGIFNTLRIEALLEKYKQRIPSYRQKETLSFSIVEPLPGLFFIGVSTGIPSFEDCFHDDGTLISIRNGHVQKRFAHRFHELMRREGGSIRLSESPGGIYAAAVFDRQTRKLHAWQSLAMLERIYYGDRNGWLAVSSSPLLAAILMQGEERTAFEPAWVEDAIAGSGPIGTQTHFSGIKVLAIREMLSATGQVQAVTDFPLSIAYNVLEQHSEEGIARVHEEMLHAFSCVADVARGGKGARLHLSGGKDSRMLASFLPFLDYDVSLLTFGNAQARFSRPIGNILGKEILVETAPIFTEDEIIDIILPRVADAEGLYTHQIHLIRSKSLKNVSVSFEGHAHHLRGGYATPAKVRSMDQLWEKFLKYFSEHLPYFNPAVQRRKLMQLKGAFHLSCMHGIQDALYHAYEDLRPGSIMPGSHRLQKRMTTLFYPMMCERVLMATGLLHSMDRRSEYTFFKVLERNNFEMAHLPLYDSVWRFQIETPPHANKKSENHISHIMKYLQKIKILPRERTPSVSTPAAVITPKNNPKRQFLSLDRVLNIFSALVSVSEHEMWNDLFGQRIVEDGRVQADRLRALTPLKSDGEVESIIWRMIIIAAARHVADGR